MLPPLSIVQSAERRGIDAFANAGVFVLLAMGLNVVVGLAGLLDLGLRGVLRDRRVHLRLRRTRRSPASTCRSSRCSLVGAAGRRASSASLLGAPTLRLRGDYLAIVTLGFGEIVPIVFLNLDKYTQGTNGIGGIYRPEPLPLLGEFTLGSTRCRTT